MEKSTFRVIIVGGSIAGLTLAHCLEHLGIDFLILEKATEIAPQVGASVGILPNGSRILDQLRIYSEIEKQIEPLETATISYPDGFSFSSSYPRIIHQRFGFPIAFLDRQKLLEILYTKLSDRSRIQLRSRVVSVLASDDGVTVTTDDAQTYTGQLVVGADGVHSRVRSEMWKAAQKLGQGIMIKEQQGIATEYCCVFGISSSVKGLNVGEQVNAFHDRLTIVTIHGKNGRVYWFLIQKLDQRYRYPDNPRFGPESAAVVAERVRHRRLYKNITFGQVWDKREVATMTPLEEGLLQTWHHGRMVLVGDSAHKMTPNIGQGANMAIEDAARLASLLNHLVNSRTGQQPTATDVGAMLQDYRNSRYSRVQSIYNSSRFLVRFQARDGLFNTLFGRYYAPYAGDLPADMASKTIANGEVCAFLPLRSSTEAWEIYRSRKEGVFMAPKEALVLVVLLGLVVRYFWPLVRPNLFSAQYH
ncbi:FAD-dependent oxidoreductase [Aspergillus foveolatus]|uniref:FAD-dependent oxidoreductase n=1 Tax=Aspergillus foveolatus TaxID=210207 RepID=UPI003CCD9775